MRHLVRSSVAVLLLSSACDKQPTASPAAAPLGAPARAASAPSSNPEPERELAPLLDESVDYVCFAATPREAERSLVGWVMPLPNTTSPQLVVATNPFTGQELRRLSYENPQKREPPSRSEYPEVDHLPRAGTDLLGLFALALLISAINGADVDDVEGQIEGQMLLTAADDEVGVIHRVPRHLVQSIASVKASDVAAVAARWKPRLIYGAQYGDEASQPPIAERERVVAVAVELSALALRSGRDLYLWDKDF